MDGSILRWIFAGWVLAATLAGAVLTSFHQPFRSPEGRVAGLAAVAAPGRWHAVHVLSGACGCSQKVMRALLERGPAEGVREEIVMVDGVEGYLAGSAGLLQQLVKEGFVVSHRKAVEIAPELGLRGVPLLLVMGPEGGVRYSGGYGPAGNESAAIVAELRRGRRPAARSLVGCAVGASLRQAIDPLGWKY
jgi:hypothetical protein